MVEEIPKPIDTDLQFKEEESVEESQSTEDRTECKEQIDNCEEKGLSLSAGRAGEIVQGKKRSKKRTNLDEEQGIFLRRERDRLRQRLARQNEDEEKRKLRLEKDRIRKRSSRQNEDEFERLKRRDKDRERRARKREMERSQREGYNKTGENGENFKNEKIATNVGNCNGEENQETVNMKTDENTKETVKNNSNDVKGQDSPSSEDKDKTES